MNYTFRPVLRTVEKVSQGQGRYMLLAGKGLKEKTDEMTINIITFEYANKEGSEGVNKKVGLTQIMSMQA